MNRSSRSQRGVVLLFGLIVLAIMLVGAAAMVRSMNTSMFNAGNLGFKRDMANQVERVVAAVSTDMLSGNLATEVIRQSHVLARNYSATLLPSNAQGIPNALLSDTVFATVGTSARDITVAGQAVTMRYVLDRLCTNTGAANATHCTMNNDPLSGGGGLRQQLGAATTTVAGAGASSQRVVYRLSVRVTGPRNTQAFFQQTVTL
jgi:type IV pilus assembly protein PilX